MRGGIGPGPVSTQAIEDLIARLEQDYTIVIVTHNMAQGGPG